MSSNGYLNNVEDIFFQINEHYDANPLNTTSYTYTSNKVVIKASDIKKILDDRGVIYH